MNTPKRAPCADCPWRKDAPKGYWHPSHFLSVWFSCQDDGQSLMLCHQSKKQKRKIICAGYALIVGYKSIGLRMANLDGKYDPNDYDACGIPLHGSFDEMMKAQGIEPPPRNRVLGRHETVEQAMSRIRRTFKNTKL
jgi:hypothetical protein